MSEHTREGEAVTNASVDALAGLKHEHLLYFARRALEERLAVRPRRYGVSSNAMVDYALGFGRKPWLVDFPSDSGDLAACELAYETAPADLQPLMLPILRDYRQMIAFQVVAHD